jgi:hypothetical protein
MKKQNKFIQCAVSYSVLFYSELNREGRSEK